MSMNFFTSPSSLARRRPDKAQPSRCRPASPHNPHVLRDLHRAELGRTWSRSKRRVGKGAQRRAHASTLRSYQTILSCRRPNLWAGYLPPRSGENCCAANGNVRHEAVFDRIVVDVVDMPLGVGIVTDGVLPISPLPNALLALGDLARGTFRRRRQATRKNGFEHTPARRVVGVALRELPQRMQMVGEDGTWTQNRTDGAPALPRRRAVHVRCGGPAGRSIGRPARA